jgi:hypothetical protein
VRRGGKKQKFLSTNEKKKYKFNVFIVLKFFLFRFLLNRALLIFCHFFICCAYDIYYFLIFIIVDSAFISFFYKTPANVYFIIKSSPPNLFLFNLSNLYLSSSSGAFSKFFLIFSVLITFN